MGRERFPTLTTTVIAIIHYKPTEEDCAVIDRSQMYLCDSGGRFSPQFATPMC